MKPAQWAILIGLFVGSVLEAVILIADVPWWGGTLLGFLIASACVFIAGKMKDPTCRE